MAASNDNLSQDPQDVYGGANDMISGYGPIAPVYPFIGDEGDAFDQGSAEVDGMVSFWGSLTLSLDLR